MKKGELWLVEIPDRGGHVQRGTRPALVLADKTKTVVTIAPLTSSAAASQLPYTITVESTARNGLATRSVLLAYQIGAIDKRFLRHKIGILEKAVVEDVEETIKKLFEL